MLHDTDVVGHIAGGLEPDHWYFSTFDNRYTISDGGDPFQRYAQDRGIPVGVDGGVRVVGFIQGPSPLPGFGVDEYVRIGIRDLNIVAQICGLAAST